MKSKAAFLSLLLLFCFAVPALAGGFDCADPPYGAPLADINKDGAFVKFMEKDGVAYYNYTGQCKLKIHERTAPAVAYGFVDGKLYSRIMRTWNDSMKSIEEYTSRHFSQPKITGEGDWRIMKYSLAGHDVRLKIKLNTKTGETKSAAYYEPLRSRINNANAAENPEGILEN